MKVHVSDPRALFRTSVFLPLITVLMAAILSRMGRVLGCLCGSWIPWSWDIWSRHNSQHLIDPYSLTHVLHGVILWGILSLSLSRQRPQVLFCLAMAIEALWEIVENSPIVIDRYRTVTISLDYTGDSIVNSLGDLASCAIGYLIAVRLQIVRSTLLFAACELLLLVTIRDCLVLNVVMLLFPVEAIRQWQSALR
ncbi:MAG: DUF2585 family protein [Planctomyces sp.]